MDARIRAKERYSSLTLTDMVRAGQVQLAAPIAHKAVQLKFVVRDVMEIANLNADDDGLICISFNDVHRFWWMNQPAEGIAYDGYPAPEAYTIDPLYEHATPNWRVYQMRDCADMTVEFGPAVWQGWGIPYIQRQEKK